MKLDQFLSYFNFSYDICFADSDFERNLRLSLVAEGALAPEVVDKPLIYLIDHQGVYLGNVDRYRFSIDEHTVENIICRMDSYIQGAVISEFVNVLEDRYVDTSEMNLAQMIVRCKSLGFGEGSVSYSMADVILNPKTIKLPELGKTWNVNSSERT